MHSRGNVLIVEENHDQREILAISVAAWGYKIKTACDGYAAIEALASFPAQVVVTALVMPRLDGIELLRCLKKQGYAMPTIVMTAHYDMNRAVTACMSWAPSGPWRNLLSSTL